jgi:hypothetical protein
MRPRNSTRKRRDDRPTPETDGAKAKGRKPPKPTERKRKAGNPGKRPIREPLSILPAIEGPPKPPESLEDAGMALWDHVLAPRDVDSP